MTPIVWPQRIQMSRQRPWRSSYPAAVIVARPSKWGNPFRWDQYHQYPSAHYLDGTPREHEDMGRIPDAVRRAHAVQDFRNSLLHGGIPARYPSVDDIRGELAGRDLACWCPLWGSDGLRMPCHGDVLLIVANPGWTPELAGTGSA